MQFVFFTLFLVVALLQSPFTNCHAQEGPPITDGGKSSIDTQAADFDLFQLSRDKLLQLNAESDASYEQDLGHFLGEFFHDSDAQLVLDLDLFRQLWTELDTLRESTVDGNLDYVQAVINFFEPLSEYDISAPCLSDLSHFLLTTYNYAKTASAAGQCTNCSCTQSYRTEFRKFQWIFDVVDAMGKVPAAVVSGNNLWTGSWATCRKISAVKNQQGQLWQGQYCMARFQPYNRHNPLKAFVSAPVDPTAVCSNANNISGDGTRFEDWNNWEKTCFDMMPLLNLGLCTPDSCTDYDVRKLVQFVYNSVELAMDQKLVCNVSVKCSNSRPESQIYHDAKSMAVLYATFLLLLLALAHTFPHSIYPIQSYLLLALASLMLFGTCYDVYVHRPLARAIQEQQMQMVETTNGRAGATVPTAGIRQLPVEPRSWLMTFLMMFSVARNLDYILDTRTEDGQIRCLHGARFMSMSWVIFGHTYYYICTSLTTDNLLQTLHEFPKYFYNQLVVQAPLAVDSFFLLSGLLTSYIFLVKLQKRHFRLGSFSTWFAYYVRRYLRLTPVYVLVMLMEITVFNYISEGPFWRPIDPNFCRNSWWANLLYINNFVRQDDACMGWTWYLANDFQLYAFAPILIIALHKFKLGGVLFGVFLIVISTAINLTITIQRGYPPAPLLTSKLQIVAILNDYWTDLYVKPYIRCGPYIIGCIVGFLLAKCKRSPTFQLSTFQWVLGWALSTALGAYSIFGLFHFTKTGEISTWYSLMYTALGRLSFALALGWLTFACETNHGQTINAILGHKMFVPLSKITFCAYLLHPILLQLYYLSRPSAFHFTHSFQLLLMFFAAVACSYGCALALSLTMEMPIVHLDKLLFGPGGQRFQSTRSTAAMLEKLGAEQQCRRKSSSSGGGSGSGSSGGKNAAETKREQRHKEPESHELEELLQEEDAKEENGVEEERKRNAPIGQKKVDLEAGTPDRWRVDSLPTTDSNAETNPDGGGKK